MNSHSLLFSLFILLLSIAANGHFCFGKAMGQQRSRRVAAVDNGNFIVVDGSVSVVNGVISGNGCYYHDGKVTDYGKTRTLTGAERAKLKKFIDEMQQMSVKFAQEMQRMFSATFPFGPPAAPPPQFHLPPQVPCFCSSSSCSKFREKANRMK
ncbi:hypothetical protein niasHS_017979 [Heterodera schachtii]|uniref:Pepsin inhibitor-3-like repeated domain-containing protein n=2 Tax=Heterodera TaxID=34509 RepID=A0ABD2I733_HETSC